MVIFNIQVLRLLWKKRNGFKQFLINIWFKFDFSFKKAIQTNDDDDDDDDDDNAFLKVREKTSEEKVKILVAYIVCEIFCLVLAKLAEPPHCLFRDVNLWRSKIWRLCSALAPPISVTTSLSPSPPRWQVQINPFCKLYNMGVAYIVGHYWCLTCTWNTEHQNLLL